MRSSPVFVCRDQEEVPDLSDEEEGPFFVDDSGFLSDFELSESLADDELPSDLDLAGVDELETALLFL